MRIGKKELKVLRDFNAHQDEIFRPVHKSERTVAKSLVRKGLLVDNKSRSEEYLAWRITDLGRDVNFENKDRLEF